jgi:hypothetical protein
MTDNQNDQTIVRQYGEFSVGAWLVTGSKDSAPVVSSSVTTHKEAGEADAERTNILTLHKEAGQPARRNATGPRTALGKKRSSQNAIKFGIFSKATLLKSESRAEFESLRNALWKSKQPGDEFEELLLDKMVSNLWRQRRVLVAECAEILRNSEFVEFDRRREEEVEAEEISGNRSDGLIWNIQNPYVRERCKELLVKLHDGIQTDGLGWSQASSTLQTIYGDTHRPHLRPTLYEAFWAWLRTATLSETERQEKGYATREQCEQEVLRQITAEINYLKHYQDKRESIESKRKEVEFLRQRVPDSPAMDRLLRQENSLERAFDRLLTQYERAQRMRKGQPLPPQLDVKIS